MKTYIYVAIAVLGASIYVLLGGLWVRHSSKLKEFKKRYKHRK